MTAFEEHLKRIIRQHPEATNAQIKQLAAARWKCPDCGRSLDWEAVCSICDMPDVGDNFGRGAGSRHA